MSLTNLWVVLAGIVLVVGVFLLTALLLQWLVNIVLAQYGVPGLEYGSALAVNGLVWLLSGARKVSD